MREEMSTSDPGARRRSIWTTSSQYMSRIAEETMTFELSLDVSSKDQPKDFSDPDDLLKALGNPGRFQVIQFILLCGQFIPLAMTDMMSIFFSLSPIGVRVLDLEVESNATMAKTDEWNSKEGRVSYVTDFKTVASCEANNLTNLQPSQISYVYQNQWQWSIIADVSF